MKSGIIILPVILRIALVQANFEPYKSDPYIACSSNEHCPEEWPCCSQYGQCGFGPLCAGGCDPRFSFSYDSCGVIPAMFPQMSSTYQIFDVDTPQSQGMCFVPAIKTSFKVVTENRENSEMPLSGRGLLHYSKASDPSVNINNFDFTYSGSLEVGEEEEAALVLAMPPGTTGSVISSAKSFLYGRVAVEMKSAKGNGVISAMVLMSAVKDEVDFEFLGGDLENAQSNYYYRGELIHTRMAKSPISPNSYDEYHTYEFDWDEDRIQWLIDGSVVRTLHREDTYDAAEKIYRYPSTPMRLELAIWPGGLESNDPGTVMWAGGLIDWQNAAEILDEGQFQMSVKNVKITPYVNAFVPLTAQGSAAPDNDIFYYFYDAECDGCVRSRKDSPQLEERLLDNVPQQLAENMSNITISTIYSDITTTSSVMRTLSSAAATQFTVTRHENFALPLKSLNALLMFQIWISSWVL
ncbi:LANO_0E01838g1_1 [Lachancea nothofagi CBS 11611]|uniref:LANO_0E01838g1_1 n=1 Tax=Lachancea nothofagi CBS 11611 TaxID=1266666 RepID=A0A1G4JQ30_9SACH|nr:LANO_0E01838g1_1 [Lachancea nothofagi CBS 11611]